MTERKGGEEGWRGRMNEVPEEWVSVLKNLCSVVFLKLLFDVYALYETEQV